MTINHINFSVNNVTDTANFFTRFFDFKCVEEKGNGIIAILANKAGFILVITLNKKSTKTDYPADFHIGFLQQSDEQVIEIHKRLTAGGFMLEREPQKIRGNLGFYFHAPGNILVEVSSQ